MALAVYARVKFAPSNAIRSRWYVSSEDVTKSNVYPGFPGTFQFNPYA